MFGQQSAVTGFGCTALNFFNFRTKTFLQNAKKLYNGEMAFVAGCKLLRHYDLIIPCLPVGENLPTPPLR